MIRTRRFVLRATMVAAIAASAAPGVARADHGGCYTYGEVMGLDVIRTCTYVAQTDTQNVYVGTPATWRVWVTRYTPQGQPVEVILASGDGPPAGLPQVHPEVGETVHVSMDFWCPPTYNPCGTYGFIGAGLEEGHP